MNENETGNKAFDLMELLSAIWKYKFFIIAFVAVVVIASGIKLKYFTADLYTSKMTFYLSSKDDEQSAALPTNSIKLTDITAARTFGDTCTQILKESSFFYEVAQDSGTKYTEAQINSMTSISTVDETEVLSIKVTTPSEADTYKIAKSISKLAPAKVFDITEGGSFKLMKDVSKPAIVSKNVVNTLLISAVISFILACGVIFLIMIFDKKVHRSEDVAKRYGISILGEISK